MITLEISTEYHGGLQENSKKGKENEDYIKIVRFVDFHILAYYVAKWY